MKEFKKEDAICKDNSMLNQNCHSTSITISRYYTYTYTHMNTHFIITLELSNFAVLAPTPASWEAPCTMGFLREMQLNYKKNSCRWNKFIAWLVNFQVYLCHLFKGAVTLFDDARVLNSVAAEIDLLLIWVLDSATFVCFSRNQEPMHFQYKQDITCKTLFMHWHIVMAQPFKIVTTNIGSIKLLCANRWKRNSNRQTIIDMNKLQLKLTVFNKVVLLFNKAFWTDAPNLPN